ncbi:efflux transporter, outer membrane factor (OMF) lipoprotein, NodT family [Dyadobacter koreensis]|uniref:Efflux transporter, outer membrane factor (OMF) lipoprotein, NodT family n=2 Tax=Dyadobacter koreensis TaxID=408657 RepID=A0A1H6UMJ0_9BACT|nr:efflux transporter, outer membrane factor (OMF) lipoprotein, NodT family [Dyadobacter koreensis]
MMRNKKIINWVGITLIALTYTACSVPSLVQKTENKVVPVSYKGSQDSTNSGKVSWKVFFTDTALNALIDTALVNNQELNITMQEIEISKNEVMARKGEYRPFVSLGGAAGVEKASRYTLPGATEEITEIKPGKKTPDPLSDFRFGASATWEIDIWHKLRNAKKAAVSRYLASVEGKNFMMTNIVSEIANNYYELLALDSQLEILQRNIEIQSNALRIVKMEKEATKVTELAVRRFQAQVLNTQNLQYDIKQRIVEAENRINFLVGRYPQPVARTHQNFETLLPAIVQSGIPSQLLENRPDVRQAENELAAAKLDVQVAKANFYPRLGLTAMLGIQSFSPIYLAKAPKSIISSIAGDLAGPLVNKNAIKATYYSANAKQIQAVYDYQRTVLNAYIEVTNQLSRIDNLEKSYDLKKSEVEALTESINISNRLFASARADYMEVLLTQRDALESRFDLVETKMNQMNAMVDIYRALGGGWK